MTHDFILGAELASEVLSVSNAGGLSVIVEFPCNILLSYQLSLSLLLFICTL